jgi:hypothetical protein
MGILTGKKSTALSNPNLCRSCAWGQFMSGFRDAERLAVCTNTSPNMVVPFAMLECSAFHDRHRPDPGPLREPPAGEGTGRFTAGIGPAQLLRPLRKMRNGASGDGVFSKSGLVN